nr:ADP-ribosylation factor-like protein [Candidatus Sigynarchaeota archaeon]
MAISKDDEKFKNAKKLIFAGLDNSGKTSINTVVSENAASLGLIKPTYLVKRSMFQYLDYDFISCDMGGQKKYLISYFKEPGKYFDAVDACIFVIDVQDGDRIQQAVNYFRDILVQFTTFKIQPRIFVFFHKAERILYNGNTDDTENMNEAKRIINDINADRFALEFHVTTIVDVWSITKAFAMIMNYLYPVDGLVGGTIKNLVTAVNAMISVLIDDHMIPVAQNMHTKQTDELISASAPNMFTLKQSMDRVKKKPSKMVTFVWEGYNFVLATLPEAQVHLHLLLIGAHGSMKIDTIEKETTSALQEIYAALKIE